MNLKINTDTNVLACRFSMIGILTTILLLTGCSASMLQSDLTTSDGRKVVQPSLFPSNSEEIDIDCRYQARKSQATGSSAAKELRECRENRQATLRERTALCRQKVQLATPRVTAATAIREAVNSCVRDGKSFAMELARIQQFELFAQAKTPEEFEAFARQHDGNDILLLVSDAKKRAAISCAVGPSIEAPVATHKAWVTRFLFMADDCQQAFVQVRARIASMERAGYTKDIDNLASWEQANDFLRSNGKTLPDDLARIVVAKRASLRQAAINSGGFSAVLPLAHDGDREAILRAVSLAVSSDQKVEIDRILVNTNEVELVLTHGGFYALLLETQRQGRNGDRRALVKLMDIAQSDEQKKQAQLALQQSGDLELILAKGDFKTTLISAQAGVQRAVKRTYELAKTDSEKRQAESALVGSVRHQLLTHKVRMEGTGQTQTSDVDAFISRKVQAKVRSTVDYELAFDPSVFVPKFDYLVSARVHVRVNGKVNGNKNCGLLWMSNCKIDNVDSSEDYFVPVKVAMRAATRFRNAGSVSVDWESTSGGSGMAGGLIMGGTRVFTATGIVLALIVDSIESQP